MMSLRAFLENVLKGKNYLIVCMGNSLRGDDSVGLLVGQNLISHGCENVIIVESSLENALGFIIEKKPEVVLFIDAVHSSLEEGDIIFVKIGEYKDSLRTHLLTTHSLPFSLLLEYLKQELPNTDFYLVGIQVSHTIIGTQLCSKVEKAEKMLVKVMLDILKRGI
ncbi:MAG: hypothetical protein B6U94_04410 [Thermofilum sp. ex4484_79]|nr:MAG: hypothetical protein B6U94_04410 [Thermofilum sp. ex4484_79]